MRQNSIPLHHQYDCPRTITATLTFPVTWLVIRARCLFSFPLGFALFQL